MLPTVRCNFFLKFFERGAVLVHRDQFSYFARGIEKLPMAGDHQKDNLACKIVELSKHLGQQFVISGQVRAPSSAHREGRITFYDVLLELGSLAAPPQRGAVDDAIEKGSAVGAFASLERARDAHKLAFESVARYSHHRITVASHVDEREVRSELWIGQRSRPREITRRLILEAASDAAPQEQVDRRLRWS